MKNLEWQRTPKYKWSRPWWHQTVDTEYKIVDHWFGFAFLQFRYTKSYV